MIFSIDPGLGHTGFALLSGDATKLIDYGAVTPECDDGDVYSRAKSIADQICREIENSLDAIETVVIEAPQTIARGVARKRSASTLPNYGECVGVLTHAVDVAICGTKIRLLRPSATEWTRGMPSTNRDTHKTKRVRAVLYRFDLADGALGPKSIAGNVADAVLLGCWAAARKERMFT